MDKKKDRKDQTPKDGEFSPLMQILDKEKELRYLMKEAEEKAEQMIVDARLKAGEIKREAYDDSDIRVMYEEKIKETQKEAQQMKETSREEVQEVQAFGRKRLDKAVDTLMKSVLPGD